MSKPVLLPEPFNGEPDEWNEWVTHFENVAVVNKWETGEEKLKWLRVRLTGKAQTAFMKLPEAARGNYGECIKALQKRFAPDSRRELYVAELNTRKKRRDEDWASFGDALRVLSDRAYPDLEDKAKERLSLNQYLSQIEDSQVAFGVKQKRPSNVEEAVAATIELESYLNAATSSSKSHRHVDVFVPQKSARDSQWGDGTKSAAVSGVAGVDEKLLTTLESLSERLHRLETSMRSNKDHPPARVEKQPDRRRNIVCWNCGKKCHTARVCRNSSPLAQQGNFSPSGVRATLAREDL